MVQHYMLYDNGVVRLGRCTIVFKLIEPDREQH